MKRIIREIQTHVMENKKHQKDFDLKMALKIGDYVVIEYPVTEKMTRKFAGIVISIVRRGTPNAIVYLLDDKVSQQSAKTEIGVHIMSDSIRVLHVENRYKTAHANPRFVKNLSTFKAIFS